jgi:hypothetical protein
VVIRVLSGGYGVDSTSTIFKLYRNVQLAMKDMFMIITLLVHQ